MKKTLKLVLSLLVTCVFAYLAFGRMDWGAALDSLRLAGLPLLFLGLFFLAVDYFIKILRWWIILRNLGPRLPLSDCVRPFLLSFAFNNIFPLRAGDVARVFGFRKNIPCSSATVLGTLFIERLLDFFSLLLFFFIGLAALPSGVVPDFLVRSAGLAAAGMLVMLLALVFLPDLILKIFNYILESATVRRLPLASRLKAAGADFLSSLKICRNPLLGLKLLVLSCLAWLFEAGLFASVAWSLNIDAGFQAALFSMSTGTLATLLPSTPGYIGTFDYFTILGLTAFGAGKDVAGIYALLCHVLLWVSVTIAGLACGLGHECRAILGRARMRQP